MADETPTPAPALGAMPSNPAPAAPQGDGGQAPAPTVPTGVVIPENWKDALPEEFRKESSIESIKSIDDLAKSYVHAQKMVGKDKVVVPDPKFASEADWKAFYQKVGQPKDLEGYKVETPKDAKFDEGFLNDFREQAFKMNILPGQAKQLLAWYSAKEAEAIEGAQAHAVQEVQSNLDAYKKQVGAAFEKKVILANRTLEKYGGPEVQKWMQSNPAVGSNPHLIEMLSKLGEHLYSEDTFEGSEKVRGAMTPDEAQSEITTIMGDSNHPYFQGKHPGHQKAVEHMQKLFKFANP